MTVRELIDRAPVTRLQMMVITLCFLLNMLDGLDVMAIAYVAPSLSSSLALTANSLGAIFSAGVIGTTLGALFIAPYADLHGRRTLILSSLLFICVTMTLTGFARSFWEFFLIRLANGLGIGAMLASLTTMGAEYMPNRHRNLAIGILHSGYLIGATVGGFFAAWLIPAFGWQAVFFAGGSAAMLLAPLIYFFMPESLQFLSERSPPRALEKFNAIMGRMRLPSCSDLPPREMAETLRPGVRALLASDFKASTLMVWLAFFATFVSLYFVQSWMPKMVVDAGLDLSYGIYAGVAVNTGGAMGAILLGYWSATAGLHRLITIFLIAGSLSMIVFGFSPTNAIWLVGISLFIGFFMLAGFIGLYVVTARVYPTQVRTTGIGWAVGAGRAGAICSPFLGGLLISLESSKAVNFALFAIPLLIAGLAIWRLRPPKSAAAVSPNPRRVPSVSE